MPSPAGEELAAALQRYLTTKLDKDPATKALLVALARVVLETCAEEGTASEATLRNDAAGGESARATEPPSEPAKIIARPGEVAPAKVAIVGPRVMSEGIVPLKIGGVQMHLRVEGSSNDLARARQSIVEAEAPEPKHNAATPTDEGELLELIVKRTTIKMRACEVAKQRRAADKTGEQREAIRTQVAGLIAEAKALPNCFLWMFMPGHDIPDDGVMDMIRECYGAMHDATKTAATLLAAGSAGGTGQLTTCMKMMAEAQNGLRVILKQTWLERDDMDQFDAFMWLRRTAEVQHIFVDRFMRLDDPADPVRAPQLRAEISALAAEVERATTDTKQSKKALNKIKYHAQRIAEAGEASEAGDWRSLQTGVAGLGSLSGLDARSREQLEEMLAPVAKLMDDNGVPTEVELDGAFGTLLDTIQRKRERQAEKEAEREAASGPRYSSEVLQVRGLLGGKRLVLIGGTRFPQQEQRLRDAFELADFDWISLREHASSAPMEPVIAKADTALVVAITRLAGHHHIDDARDYARRHGKPFVQLPAGHSPEQVAKAVMEQVGERLAAAM